jgi:two-component system sensor histidine kinase EvgS
LLLNLLIIEDSKIAAKGVVLYIKKHSVYKDVNYKIVETREDMKTALEEQIWDAIICDHHMPYFDSHKAFDLYKEFKLDIPFIIVSGVINEEMACEAMKMGVHDYIIKDKIQRLVPALERELKRAEERRQFRSIEENNKLIFEEALGNLSDTLKNNKFIK